MQSKFSKALTDTINKLSKTVATKWSFILLWFSSGSRNSVGANETFGSVGFRDYIAQLIDSCDA